MALISTEGTKAHYKRQFWSFLTLISQSKYKKLETLIRWHMVDSWLTYSGLMKNGVCQLFLKFAYWVTAFWIHWPDYKDSYHYVNLLIAWPKITTAIIMHAHSCTIWLTFNDLCHQINSMSLVYLLLLNININLSLRLYLHPTILSEYMTKFKALFQTPWCIWAM